MEQNTGVSIRWGIDELIEIARWQRFIIWMVLLQVATVAVTVVTLLGSSPNGAQLGLAYQVFALGSLVLRIVVVVLSMYGIYKLAAALRNSYPLLCTVAMFIPLLSLVVLLVLSNNATKLLQMGGIRVGVMGADQSDLERLKIQGDTTA